MEIIDISWPITEDITLYKDRGEVKITRPYTLEKNNVNVSAISFETHTGTHVDAPNHFMEGKTIDQLSLNQLCGPCTVLDFSSVEDLITVSDLQKHEIKNGQIVLLKTKNSTFSPTAKFNFDFTALTLEGAQYLAQKNIPAIGIDYLSVEKDQPDHPAHHVFMQKNVPIIEGLRLQHVQPGEYTLYCLPLHLPGLEAAPARAILIKN